MYLDLVALLILLSLRRRIIEYFPKLELMSLPVVSLVRILAWQEKGWVFNLINLI